MTLSECFGELAWLARRGFPMSATQLFYTLMLPTTLAFCGTLGTEDLDAAGLALSIYQLTVENCASSVRWGLMPFLAQTMGGTKKHRVGNFVQRGLLAALLLTGLNWALAMNSANLLILLGQDSAISVKAERFLIILMPGSLAMNLCEALIAYTDTVGYLWPTFLVRCVSLSVNVLLQYVTVLQLGMGLTGSAIGLSVSLTLMPAMQATLIWCLKIHRDTWTGWSSRAFMDWGKFLLTVLPCLLTQTLWIFGTEYGNFLAGLLGKAEIAAESVLFQLNIIAYLIPVGIGSALIARIGFYLGSQQPDKARRLLVTSLAFMTAVGGIVGLAFFLLRFQVPRIFSLEPEAASLYAELSPYLALYTAFQLAAYPSIAALRACSCHLHTMLMNFTAYYILGAPLGVALAFASGWGLHGLWTGFVTASASFCLLLGVCALRLDWRRRSAAAHLSAEMETDMELLGERRCLLPRDPDACEAGEDVDKASRATSYQQLSASTSSNSGARQRSAVRSKLPVLLAVLGLLAASLTLRLLAPPRVTPGGHDGLHGNASVVATAVTPALNQTVLLLQ